jgi:catechol 2,3-dioxygenase-like lactoylglutathione lyase family enzyme
MEGLTLAVKDVSRSLAFYGTLLGLGVEVDNAPDFGMIRVAGGDTIGLLAARHANRKGVKSATRAQHAAIHVELSTDDLDDLYRRLKARDVRFHEPPHDEAWSAPCRPMIRTVIWSKSPRADGVTTSRNPPPRRLKGDGPIGRTSSGSAVRHPPHQLAHSDK